MARKKMAVGGVQSVLNRRRNYLFDENDGIVEFDNSPEPTTVSEEVEPASTPTRTRRTVSRRTNKPSSNEKNSGSIINIGAKRFSTAFKQARVAGLDKFRWKGKVYGTKVAGETGSTTKEKSANAAKSTKGSSQSNTTATQSQQRPRRQDLTNASRTTNNTNTNSNTTPNTRNERRVINTPTSGLVNADVIRNPTASGWINEFGERYRNIRRSINTATANRQRVDPSFYEARQRAKSNGAKSFTWHGQIYSTYGASNNTTNTYGKKK